MTSTLSLIPAPLTPLVDAPVVPKIKVDRGLALRLMDAAIDARGYDFVQTTCSYSAKDEDDNREPLCIVGYVLYLLLGEALFKHVMNSSIVDNDSAWGTVYQNVPGVTFTPAAVRALHVAQQAQDGRIGTGSNLPWGQARSIAANVTLPIMGLDNDDE